MIAIVKTYLLEYLNEKMQDPDITPQESGIIARLIAYININLK